jgi:hypothetical protein
MRKNGKDRVKAMFTSQAFANQLDEIMKTM